MTIIFRKLIDKDKIFLEKVLIDSFNEDSERAFSSGKKEGPPGYDNGELAKKILNDRKSNKLVIQVNEIDCGILVYQEEPTQVIDYFCILPVYANKGLGSEVWHVFEQNKTGVWVLETPDFSIRNHHFYEKNGFQKVAEKTYGPKAKSFVFQKDLGHV